MTLLPLLDHTMQSFQAAPSVSMLAQATKEMEYASVQLRISFLWQSSSAPLYKENLTQ